MLERLARELFPIEKSDLVDIRRYTRGKGLNFKFGLNSVL